MSEHRTCASGCTIRGRHRTDCQDVCDCKGAPDNHRPGCDGTCSGCLPRAAEHGQLCAWCFQRLNSDVATAPALVRHLREVAEPHAGTQPLGDGGSARRHSERNLLSGAVDAADEVHAMLASWVHLILDEHPDGDRMTGPDQRGTWHTQYGATAGIRHPDATARLVEWLLPWLPWCAEQEWAAEMRREIGDVVRTTLARWPMADDRTRHIPGIACPRCDQVALTYTPPAVERAPFVVACANPECGRVFSEDEWTRLVGLLAIAERRTA